MLNTREKAYIRSEIIRLVGRIASKVTNEGEPLSPEVTLDISKYFYIELDYVMGNLTAQQWEDGKRNTSIYGR